MSLSHAFLYLFLHGNPTIVVPTNTLICHHSHFADNNSPTETQLVSGGAGSQNSSVRHQSLCSQPPHCIHVTSNKCGLHLLQSLALG